MSEAIGAEGVAENDPSVGLGEGVATEVAPTETEQPAVGTEPAIPSQFTVKVGGEEMQVTLEEALNGYQRQADYTRKTQELAQEREQLSHAERLWNQIEANPQVTIGAIAEAYGFKLSPAQEAQLEQQRTDALDDDGEPDPDAARWQQVEQFMEQAQMAQLQAQIDRELVDLHETYGKFDDQQLLNFAYERQIGNLGDAFKAFAFEAMTKVASDRRVQQTKQTAPPIAGGHGVAAGAVAPGAASSRMSVRDAFAAAEAAHAAS